MNIFIIIFTLIATISCVYGSTLAEECEVVGSLIGEDLSNTETCCSIKNGVECEDGHIIKLTLWESNLIGTIPKTIKKLTELVILELGGNSLTGEIPEEIGDLKKLINLNLSGNQLTGSIPNSIGQLENLKELFLSDNSLTGKIPEWIGDLKNLVRLGLGGNLLTGSFPDSVEELKNIQDFDYSNNCFDCSTLESKYLYNGYFMCTNENRGPGKNGCPIDIPDCPELYENKNSCDGEGTPVTYCYSATNRQLIGFSSSHSDKNECDKAFDLTESKVNILNLDGNIETANLGKDEINIESIVIYDCDENTCQRMTGLIKHSNGDMDEFLYVGTPTTDDSSIDLCSSDNEYLVYVNDKEDAKVYKCDDYAKKFTGENGKNVCVDGTSIIWADRSKALCNAESDCFNYYDCTDGECKLSRKNSITVRDNVCKPSLTGVLHCSEGYHLTNNDGTALATSDGKLWYCDSENCKNLENYAGYFRNADDGNKPNILCVNNEGSNKCEKVEFNYGSCSSIGEVITQTQNSDDYALCTSTLGSGLLLSESESKQYMVAIDKTNGLYEIKPNTDADDKKTQFYLVVLVDTDANVRVVREIEPIRYRYTNGKNDPLIYDRSSAQDAKNGNDENAICKTNHNPLEYKLDQWTEALQTNPFTDFYIVDEE